MTCDFGDGDISRSRSRLPHTRPHSHIVSSIIVRCIDASDVMIGLLAIIIVAYARRQYKEGTWRDLGEYNGTEVIQTVAMAT